MTRRIELRITEKHYLDIKKRAAAIGVPRIGDYIRYVLFMETQFRERLELIEKHLGGLQHVKSFRKKAH